MERVNVLAEAVSYRIPELVDALGVSYLRRSGKKLIGCCPVHGGDNPAAFTLYPEGYNVRGLWKCWSKQCHRAFRWTLMGFVWGVLSHQKCKYDGAQNTRRLPFREAVDWLARFSGQKLESIKVDHALVEKRKFEALAASLVHDPFREQTRWRREAVRQRLIIPANYYLGRGYLPETLDRYDVGAALTPDDQNMMYNRVVVPVFDDQYQHVIGVTARSLFERCSDCGLYHADGPCPAPHARHKKWINSDGFRRELHLYNLWFARRHIERTQTFVLVESPGNVWRLEEAGVQNALASFGTALSDRQVHLIERLPVMNCVVLMDPDGAGEKAVQSIRQQLGGFLRLHFPVITHGGFEDLGAMPVPTLRERLLPYLKGIEKQ